MNGSSRYLSFVLRHQPEDANLELDEYGWCDVDDLLEKLGMDRRGLDFVVAQNNKSRFRYNSDKTKIKANQGHSIPIKDDFKQVLPPDILYHGTSLDNHKSIKAKGLKKMERNHVHLSADINTARAVGMRYAKYKNKLWLISVDAKEMNKDGFKFYLSDNNVWLTDNVPSKYILN